MMRRHVSKFLVFSFSLILAGCATIGIGCNISPDTAKSEIGTIRTAYAQCRVSGKNCDNLDKSYEKFLSSSTISRARLDVNGDQLSTVTYDLGCEWTDSEGNSGTKMRYIADTGEYRAVN